MCDLDDTAGGDTKGAHDNFEGGDTAGVTRRAVTRRVPLDLDDTAGGHSKGALHNLSFESKDQPDATRPSRHP